MALKREVKLFGAVSYGVGLILGAGIYVVIGKAAGLAGNAMWLSFVLATITALLTGLSYAELSARFPKSSGEYLYVKNAFHWESLAYVTGWLVIFSSIVAMGAVALSFAGYFQYWFGVPLLPAAIGLILVFSGVNFIGIRESIRTNILFTGIEVLGLIIVILVGLFFGAPVNYLENPYGLSGIFSASALIFFAFIGFESIVKIAEELEHPERNLPRTILLAIVTTSGIYIVVGFAVISVLSPVVLSASNAPLAEVVSVGFGATGGAVLSLIAMIATANTVLICSITASRMFYGLAQERALPPQLGRIHPKRGTPIYAVLLTMLLGLLFLLLGDLTFIVELADFGIFAVFILVNGALIQLRRHPTGDPTAYRVPGSIRNIPLSAVCGIFACAFLMLQLSLTILIVGVIILLAGGLVFVLYRRIRSEA